MYPQSAQMWGKILFLSFFEKEEVKLGKIQKNAYAGIN